MAEKQSSKLPDLKEIGQIAGKLFTDIKKSVTEICQDYKSKRQEDAANDEEKTKKSEENQNKKE